MRRWYGMVSIMFVMVVSGLLCTGMAFGAPFTNGSFESPGGDPIRYELGTNDTFVTGWTNNGGYQIYESSGRDGIPAGDGTYYVSWGHCSATGGTLSQTFDTVPGELYRVDYRVTLQQGGEAQSMKVEAFDGATLLGSASDSNFANTNWVTGPPLTFIATSSATTLIFTDLSGPVYTNWGLDAVTVTQSVPEPSILLLISSSLIGLVGLKRKCRQ